MSLLSTVIAAVIKKNEFIDVLIDSNKNTDRFTWLKTFSFSVQSIASETSKTVSLKIIPLTALRRFKYSLRLL